MIGLEVGSIRRIQGLDTAYWGFLGVGTTLDIFQNIHILYLEYGVLSLSGYGVLILFPLWSLGCDASMLLDLAEVMGSEKITLPKEFVPANETYHTRKITRTDVDRELLAAKGRVPIGIRKTLTSKEKSLTKMHA
ncbi:hypothetical protein Tco_0499906 [Tanacetum coccineum]